MVRPHHRRGRAVLGASSSSVPPDSGSDSEPMDISSNDDDDDIPAATCAAPAARKFDLEMFDPPPSEEFICTVCLNVMEDPWECLCGHVFCKACIQQWLKSHSNCPICRVLCLADEVKPIVHMVRSLISRLTVRCENSEAGCSKKVELQHFDSHKKACEFATVPCPNEGCRLHLLRKDMEEHDRMCDYHQDMCPDGCGASILRKDQANHNCIKKEKLPGKGKSSRRANEALREIRNQKSTCTALVLNKLHFAKVIRELCREIGVEDLRWQGYAIMALQEAAEAFLLCLVEDEGMRAMHMARYAHIALGLGSEV